MKFLSWYLFCLLDGKHFEKATSLKSLNRLGPQGLVGCINGSFSAQTCEGGKVVFYVDPRVHCHGLVQGDGWCRITLCEADHFSPCVRASFMTTVFLWNIGRSSPHMRKASTHPTRPTTLVSAQTVLSKIVQLHRLSWQHLAMYVWSIYWSWAGVGCCFLTCAKRLLLQENEGEVICTFVTKWLLRLELCWMWFQTVTRVDVCVCVCVAWCFRGIIREW